MRVVHVIPSLGKGGAERVVIDLANHAAAEGHDVTILAAVPVPPELASDGLRSGVALRYLHPSGTGRRSAYPHMVAWLLQNRDWILSQDVVHCHLSLGSAFGALLQLVRAGRPRPAVVETYHAVGMAIPDAVRAIHGAFLSRRDAVAFMADDPFWKRFRESRPGKLFRIIPNGIAGQPTTDPTATERYRGAAGLPAGVKIVGSIGRLVRERRPDLLIAAYCALTDTYQGEVHLLLGGEGPERRALFEQARRLGLSERVHMPGLVIEPSEPLGLLDLYLTINVGAVTGIAALEAAFSGVPVIAVQLLPDRRRTDDDWIWSSPDPAEVGAKAAELLADPERLREMGRKQQAHARAQHGVDAMAHSYTELYEVVLAKRSRPCH